MKKTKETMMKLIGILILLAVVFALGVLWKSTRGGVQEKQEITQDILQQQIQAIGELGTAKYYYTNMGRYENTLQLGGKNIPFTQKMFIISYDGTIKAGVDVKEIRVELKDRKIYLHIPAAKILSHEVEMESVTVFDEKNSIFNGLSTEDVTSFLNEQKGQMEDRAVTNGILTEAQQNAGDVLKALYQAIIDEYQKDKEEGYILEVSFETAK